MGNCMKIRKPFAVPALTARHTTISFKAHVAQSRTENKNLVSDKALAVGSDHAGTGG